MTWTYAPIDAAPQAVATRLVPIERGYVVQGVWDPGCDATAADCAQRSIGWWSADGKAWTRLPDQDTPIGNGASIVVPAGDHGVIAIDGASAWASPNGWGWHRSLSRATVRWWCSTPSSRATRSSRSVRSQPKTAPV